MVNKNREEECIRRIEELESEVAKLQAEKERLAFAFEATDDGLWEFDPRTGIAYFSPSFQTMLGYQPGELEASYQLWEKMLHPDDKVSAVTAVKNYLADQAPSYSVDFRMRTKEGKWRWIHSRGKAIQRDSQGMICRMIGTHVDVTERKKMEHQLRITQFAFDKASIGIFRIGNDGKILDVNEYACKKLGYTHEELCSMTIPDIDSNFTNESFIQHRKKITSNEPLMFESIHRRKDGSTFPVELTINYHVFEGVRFSLTFQKDISERKAAEEAISRSEERLKSIFRASSAGIGLVINRRIIDVNTTFCSMTGYSKDELIGQDSRMLYPSGEEYEYVGREKYRQIKEKNIGTVETSLRRKDGKIIHVFLSTSPLDPDNLAAGVTFIAIDITSQKQAEKEKEMIEAQYRQAQKVEAIGQLAGGVAHDLNNMLTPIIAYSDLLLTTTAEDDPARMKLKQILKAGNLARDLVRQLLAFSRRQTLQYKPLDLNKALKDFELLLRRTIRENITITIIPFPDVAPVMADIGQIEQVIMNLAINAADSMPNGGKLTIETLPVDIDAEYTESHPGTQPGRHIMLAVSDTGHGIDGETCAKIFEPFFSTKGEEGTGLGLSTVYGIVKQHNGNIWVYSEVGHGTTFKIYLPTTDTTHIEENKTSAIPLDIRGSETILLVEDNEHVSTIAQEILTLYGYTILIAKSGTEALDICSEEKTPVHLLLTDVIMPEMDGKELARKMLAAHPNLKVLYMSGYTSNVIARHGVLDQGIQFIQKPFSPEKLATKVREVLDN